MKYILPIILLFPFALHAMDDKNAKITIIKAYMANQESRGAEATLNFTPDEIAKYSLIKTMTIALPGSTATVKILSINNNAANVQCDLQYMHTNKMARLLPCFFDTETTEHLTREVTVDMNKDTVVEFGNPSYQRNKSSQVIPAGQHHLAGLTLSMCTGSKD